MAATYVVVDHRGWFYRTGGSAHSTWTRDETRARRLDATHAQITARSLGGHVQEVTR